MNEVEFIRRWAAEKGLHDAWGKYVTAEILAGLARLNLPKSVTEFVKIPPSPRLKADISILEKAFYRGKGYADPYGDITDKVGVRFVVLLERDIEIVSKVVETHAGWTWSRDRDFEEERAAHPEVFGYQSVHYIVRAKADITCNGIDVTASTPCEVQIRTLLQHAHSELTHDTIYKPKITASSETRRFVSRSMALIEVADEFFLRVTAEIERAEEPLRRAMETLESRFKSLTGVAPQPSKLNILILDAFADRLSDVHEAAFSKFLEDRPYIAQNIRHRAEERLLFRQPALLFVYYLADVAPADTRTRWPLTPTELQPIYEDLGRKFEG